MHLVNINLLFITCAYFVNALALDKYSFLLHDNNVNDKKAYDQIKQHTMEVPLDHFDENEKRTWKMMYHENLEFWQEGAPIYLFISGESKVSVMPLKSGIMFDLGKETNGAMFLSEHRYYGNTLPVSELNTENLAYLSSRQALADLAKLLEYIKSLPQYRKSKVVVVGGSYPGNLSAWMRLLYPDLVDAAIASSAPVLAKKDFYEYLETVGEDFKQYGTSGCYDKLVAKFTRYEKLFQTPDGIEQLKEEENICLHTDMKIEDNKHFFFQSKVELFEGLAQNGSPDEYDSFCAMVDEKHVLMKKRLSKGLKTSLLLNIGTWDKQNYCYNYDFEFQLRTMHRDSSYLWTYQTCTEFGYYQSTTSDKQPFTKNIPVEMNYKMCSILFGPEFNEERIDKGIENTNKMYGGRKPNVTKVVFVNGDMDPWHQLGVLKDLSADAPAILVHGTSHCADLQSLPDSEDMLKTQQLVKDLIKKWIGSGEDQ